MSYQLLLCHFTLLFCFMTVKQEIGWNDYSLKMCNFTFISKLKIRNRLQIAAAVRSDLILFDMSKMAVVSKRKSVQDIVKSVKMAPFSEYILATSAQPNYSVQITNLRSNQTIPILQKEPIAGIAWLKKNQILVNI